MAEISHKIAWSFLIHFIDENNKILDLFDTFMVFHNTLAGLKFYSEICNIFFALNNAMVQNKEANVDSFEVLSHINYVQEIVYALK